MAVSTEATPIARHVLLALKPEKFDEGLSAIADAAKELLTEQSGIGGFDLFADKEVSSVLLGMVWHSREAAARDAYSEGERWAALLDSFVADSQVTELEVSSVFAAKIPQSGARLRRFTLTFEPRDAETVAEFFRRAPSSELSEAPGFCRISYLADAEKGVAVIQFTCADDATADTLRRVAADLVVRAAAGTDAGLAIKSVHDYRCVLFEPKTEGSGVEGVVFDQFGEEIVDGFSFPDGFERPTILCNIA